MSSARLYGLVVQGMSGGEELVLCPFHQDTHASAWWHPQKQVFYCAVCGLGMNGATLAEKLGVEVDPDGEEEEEIEDYNLLDDNPVWNLGKPVYEPYMQGRGVSLRTVEAYGLRWIEHPAPAAVFQHCDLNGNITGVQYRYIDPEREGTRYRVLGTPQPLWPMHLLKEQKWDGVTIITEGGWSAMRINTFFGERGIFLPVLALLGAKANQAIADTLRPFQCVFLYDDDEAGRRACAKMRKLLPTCHAWTVKVSPDDASDEGIVRMFKTINEKLQEKA